ncbi:NAD-dependent epimerase/dehydratase family protein, partial [Nocardia brasiliensis]|uniref:NAD-dependent epimerase/dehydratase family protein n=1 Tax=Nocardia brasiliensis TaxID=37326 RepID=UPI0024555D74
MKVVIAGSSGLIGTALVAALRRDGHDVAPLVRRRAAGPDELNWDTVRAARDEPPQRRAGAGVKQFGGRKR